MSTVFKVQRVSQDLLSSSRAGSSFHNFIKCMRTPLSSSVPVYQSGDGHKHFYSGLVRCHSRWLCPVCGPTLERKSAAEISKAFHWAYSHGLKAAMLTFTLSHGKGDRLKRIISMFSAAQRLMKAQRGYRAFKAAFGVEGEIKGYEVTYSKNNGWHWHLHTVIFYASDEDITAQKQVLTDIWRRCLVKNGYRNPTGKALESFNENALDIMADCHSSDYLTKAGCGVWGADKEIALGGWHKESDGLRPVDLALSDDKAARSLWVEYALATRNIHRIRWSAGLKKRVGLQDKTDEQIIEESEMEAERVLRAVLNIHQWHYIQRYRLRSYVLALFESEGFDGVERFLQSHGFRSLARVPADIDVYDTGTANTIWQQQEEQRQYIGISSGSG